MRQIAPGASPLEVQRYFVSVDVSHAADSRSLGSREWRYVFVAQRRLAKLTGRRLNRGVFVLVVDPQAAINRFVVEHNARPKPFTWSADLDRTIRAV
jgi:hypothetical protein